MDTDNNRAKILTSVLVRSAVASSIQGDLMLELMALQEKANILEIARSFDDPRLLRQITLSRRGKSAEKSTRVEIEYQGSELYYGSHSLGKTRILYKSPLPGELQARLAIEGILDRFLEYLKKLEGIVALDESNRHVRLFIPGNISPNFTLLWESFLKDVAFSIYGNTKYKLAGLMQTFVQMLNGVSLSDRGFSKIDIPIVTVDQAEIMAGLYLAVFRETKKRQDDRLKQIQLLQKELADKNLNDRDREKKAKELAKKEETQNKEAEKYRDNWQKLVDKLISEETFLWNDFREIERKLSESNLSAKEYAKLQKQQAKTIEKISLPESLVRQKLPLLLKSSSNPFVAIQEDIIQDLDLFSSVAETTKKFTKNATDQISAVRGDIFAICMVEMYRLLEKIQSKSVGELPPPLLNEQCLFPKVRSPGDDSKDFCYSCGVVLEGSSRWQVARFTFEKPSQRRQSGTGEDRPQICSSCSVLSFASPLKVSEKSIILRLDSDRGGDRSSERLKEYARMLVNKDIHLSSGRYIVLNSDRASGGEIASQKMGQVQYALAKVASIFPLEVLTDFRFFLFLQSSQPIVLNSRQLVFIKGLMTGYNRSIIISGKDIDTTLGDAIRYIQKDAAYLAEYTIAKSAQYQEPFLLEEVRQAYGKLIQQDLELPGEIMNSEQSKRARLYRDVAALTGLTCAFIKSLEKLTTDRGMKPEDREREISKTIEQVDDPYAFLYYITLGVDTEVRSRLYLNSDNHFIYGEIKSLLATINCTDREKNEEGKIYLQFYADDITKVYTHFAENLYTEEREWKELTYNVKLSLYTRFPELVRKLKSTGDD
jgi:hypothetical protein